jgi:arylsulfatase A-like enzyme
LAGVQSKPTKPLDGKDAWPTIGDGEPSPHDVILLNATPFQGAIRKGEWKLVHNGSVRANAIEAPKKETWELFNLGDDPSESRDVHAAHPEIFRALKRRLETFAQQAEPPHLLPNRAPEEFEVPEVWGHSG